MNPRFVDIHGNELPPPPPNSLPNPDWVEPADGEITEVWMTYEGAMKGVYNSATKQVEYSPYTFTDCYGGSED